MANQKQGQVKGAEKLLSQMAKLYGLSDKGVLRAIAYADGIRDGGESQKNGSLTGKRQAGTA